MDGQETIQHGTTVQADDQETFWSKVKVQAETPESHSDTTEDTTGADDETTGDAAAAE